MVKAGGIEARSENCPNNTAEPVKSGSMTCLGEMEKTDEIMTKLMETIKEQMGISFS